MPLIFICFHCISWFVQCTLFCQNRIAKHKNKSSNINFCKKAAVLAWIQQVLNLFYHKYYSFSVMTWSLSWLLYFKNLLILVSRGKSLPPESSNEFPQLTPPRLSQPPRLTSRNFSWASRKWLGLLKNFFRQQPWKLCKVKSWNDFHR